MDRIYYFMVAKEKSGEVELPIFRKIVGPYEVYYLQVPKASENDKFVSLKAYLEKGIARIRTQCERAGALSFIEETAENIIEECGFSKTIRGEALSIKNLAIISDKLYNIKK